MAVVGVVGGIDVVGEGEISTNGQFIVINLAKSWMRARTFYGSATKCVNA